MSIVTLALPCKFVPFIVRLYPPKKWPVFGDTDVTVGVTRSEYVIILEIVCKLKPSSIYKLYGPTSVVFVDGVVLVVFNMISYPLNAI